MTVGIYIRENQNLKAELSILDLEQNEKGICLKIPRCFKQNEKTFLMPEKLKFQQHYTQMFIHTQVSILMLL